MANDIVDAEKKRAVFLSEVGPATYKLLGGQLFPRWNRATNQLCLTLSLSLSPSEQNYSQLEKEGLSCVFGGEKFHSYLFGRSFELVTDHKQLLELFLE